MGRVLQVAAWELRAATRTRWVMASGAAFGVASVGVTVLGMRTAADMGLRGLGPTASSLLGLAMIFPPLIGLLLGAGAISGGRERGTLQMLLTHHLPRSSYVVGTFLGLTATLLLVLGSGLGAAGLVIGAVAETADLPMLLSTAAASFAVATTSVALGMAISAAARTRAQATAWAVIVWFVFALGSDLILVLLIPALGIGDGGMLAAVILNPIESGRLLSLSFMDVGIASLGSFGSSLSERFGTLGTVVVLSVGLLGWCAASLGTSWTLLRRTDL